MKKKRLLKPLFIFAGSVALSIFGLYAQQGTNQYIPLSPQQTVGSGIFWPNGQMLPHFATPATQLDGFDLKKAKLQPEEKTMRKNGGSFFSTCMNREKSPRRIRRRLWPMTFIPELPTSI